MMLKCLNSVHYIAFILYVHLMHSDVCQCECRRGSFKIGSMVDCHPLLSCQDISRLDIGDLIGYGAVKHIYQSTWNNVTVALVFVNNREYIQDFMHGLWMLRELGPSDFVVQLIGFCTEGEVYVTEYHPLGDAKNFHMIFPDANMSVGEKFKFCIRYVEIIHYLHNSPVGKRVMCDSNSLSKTLEQYLITTSHSLVVNDVDALPNVNGLGIACGHKELKGDFVAPEQRWPHKGEIFVEERMKLYDEKVDIWKIPPVCDYFLGHSEASRVFRHHLLPVHERCKLHNPHSRPSASEVLTNYKKLYEDYIIYEKIKDHEEL